jgi:hypothetical protein
LSTRRWDHFARPTHAERQQIDNMSVASETNQYLTKAQKELLIWYWKLGHCHFGWSKDWQATLGERGDEGF